MNSGQPTRAVRRALALASAHNAVSDVSVSFVDKATGITTVDVTFSVSLPSDWKPAGKSPSGVMRNEVVRFYFPREYSMDSPWLSLRPDFNRNLPHMQPWLTDGRPVPCLYDGSLTELLHQEGLAGILNQTAVWLERAAIGDLLDPEQGWEPVRRDSFGDHFIGDADALRCVVNRSGGHRFFGLNYLKFAAGGRSDFVHGQISREIVTPHRKRVSEIFHEDLLHRDSNIRFGKSLALVVWPGKYPSGKPIINDTYLPETVSNVLELQERAEMYGCGRELAEGLRFLKWCFAPHSDSGTFSLAMVLLARRPFHVIGGQSRIELCPYVVEVRPPDLFPDGAETPVRPASHHHAISRPLLVQMSGGEPTSDRPCWTLVGAGSLGSKLALHLARAGNGPEVILDKSYMTPHNAARHALIPTADAMQIRWVDAKARILSDSLRGLDQKTKPIVGDVVTVLRSPKAGARRIWSKRSWAVVNSTASLVVREALASTGLMPIRVIETSLFAGGNVGIITVEGPNRNPNTADLMAEFYAILGKDSNLARTVIDSNDTMTRQNIGQGCGSFSMVMSDGRVSLFAAGMAEYILGRQRDGLPADSGEVLIGRLSDDGLGLVWHNALVLPTEVVRSNLNGETWNVHVHQRAVAKICEETSCYPDVETGGVLLGRLSEASRTVHVVDIMDPPGDSIRSAGEFVLGTTGLRRRIRTYSEATGWLIYCLGTWHSHLSPSGPSTTDRATVRAMALARLTPSMSLIRTPTGFHAILADAINAGQEAVGCSTS